MDEITRWIIKIKKEPFGSYIYLQRIFTRNSEPSSLIIYAKYTNIYKKQIKIDWEKKKNMLLYHWIYERIENKKKYKLKRRGKNGIKRNKRIIK